jgi:hypothetical protein
MPSRGQAITLSYYAYDTGASAPKTGDVANHAIRIIKDGGTPAAPTNAPTETDATDLPGWYKVTLTTAEATADVVVLGGKSSTAGVVIGGTQVTFESNVSINLSQVGLAPRALDAVADSALTVGDALVAAVCGAAGKESVAGTSYTVRTPFTGTVIRTFVLDSGTAPTSRN